MEESEEDRIQGCIQEIPSKPFYKRGSPSLSASGIQQNLLYLSLIYNPFLALKSKIKDHEDGGKDEMRILECVLLVGILPKPEINFQI